MAAVGLRVSARICCALAATLSAQWPGQAAALSCDANGIEAPEDGATDVALNVRLWAHGRFGGGSAARLYGPEGEVALDERFFLVAISESEGTPFPLSTPSQLLLPETEYRIEVDYPPAFDDGSVTTESKHFRTGSRVLTDPPSLPSLTGVTPVVADGPFLGRRGLDLSFDHQGILVGDPNGLLVSVRSVQDLLLGEDATFQALPIDAASRVLRWATLDPVLSVGLGDCVLWPDRVERHEARFGVFDLAGNFSGWSEDATVLQLPDASPGAPPELQVPSAGDPDPLASHPASSSCSMQPHARGRGASAREALALAALACLSRQAWRRRRVR
jgi:hypothetical protein